MAIESVGYTEGSGKDIAVDTIAAKEYQVIKLALGADGAMDNLVDSGQQASAASVPVVIASDQPAVTVTLDGETVELGPTALAALETITVAAITAAIPAGTNLIGSIAAALSTSAIMNGTTAVAPSYASVDTATSGDNTIVDPGAGKKVRVLAFNLIAVGTAVNVYFKTGSTDKFASSSRPLILDRTGATGPAGFNSGFNPLGWFEGAADENLVLNLSAAQGVVGNVVYVEL